MRWWEAFDSPELNALVERAISHNYSLKASNATLERARQRIAVVAGKQLTQVDPNARMEHEQINMSGSGTDPGGLTRPEERRVGSEGIRTGSSRWNSDP